MRCNSNDSFINSLTKYKNYYIAISITEIVLLIVISMIAAVIPNKFAEYITAVTLLILSISIPAAMTFSRHSKIDYSEYEDEDVRHKILIEVMLKSIVALVSIIFVKIMLI